MSGYPLIILGHRRRAYLPTAMLRIRQHLRDVASVTVVDDSGDPVHRQWLREQGINWTPVSLAGRAGYLEAMRAVWDVARRVSLMSGKTHVMLWEEDFYPTCDVRLQDLAWTLDAYPYLAQINLQRQPVYPIERRLGYLESHQHRGYEINPHADGFMYPWVERARPFTTNPSMINRKILDFDWPDTETCETTEGGAEVAMSHVLEAAGHSFAWLGGWNTPQTTHIGLAAKTGHGY